MTIINPNSIAGITSVTAEAGVMNFYKSDGTLAGLQLNGVNFNTTSGISTFSNLYVGGVLTYEDVKNVDSIGIVTAREGVVIPDTKELKFGSSAELKISNNGNAGYIQHSGSGYLFIHGNDIALRSTSQKNYIVCDSDQEVTLYYNNSPKFETTSGGINVTGKAIIDAVDVTELSNGATNNGIFLNAGDTGAGNRPYLDIKGAGTSALSGKALRVYYDNGGTESFYVDYEGNVSGKSVTIADKIIHAGDTNTFMEFDTDTITFDTAGSERVLISSTGLIWAKTRSAEVRRMILSGSPSNASFNIEAHDGESGTSSGDVQGKLGLFYNDGSTLTNTACISFERGSSAADGAMAFVTNQAERLRITSDGDMGLGANNPGADPAIGNDATVFEIRQTTTGNITSGNNRKGAVLRLKHEAQWENGYQSNNPNDDLGRVEFVTGDNSAGEGVRAAIRCRNLQYYNLHDLAFETVGPTGTSLTEKLRITSKGDVGINTTGVSYGDHIYLGIRGNSTSRGGVVHVGNSDHSVTGQFSVYNSKVWVHSGTAHPLVFGTGGANEHATLTTNGYFNIPNQPAFKASGTLSYTDWNSYEYVNFGTENFDNAGAWNGYSFTCPTGAAGDYLFQVEFLSPGAADNGNNNYILFALFIGTAGQNLWRQDWSSSGDNKNASFSGMVLQLSDGDVVRVAFHKSYGRPYHAGYNSFSGCKIS